MEDFRFEEVRSPSYEVGNVIVDYCEPFVKSLRYPYSGHRCTQCFAERGTSMMGCSICTMAFYCDEHCQSKDWDNGHQEECGLFECRELRDFCRETNNFYVCLALRFYVLKLTNHESYRKRYRMYDNSYLDVSSLKRIKFGQNEATRNIGVKLTELLTKAGQRKDLREDELHEILDVLEINKVCLLCNFQRDLIGFGIYFELNCFNQWFKPTATFINKGSQLQVRAIAPIPKGHQPTISHLMMLANSGADHKFHFQIAFGVHSHFGSYLESRFYLQKLDLLNLEMKKLLDRNSRFEWPKVRQVHEEKIKILRLLFHEYDGRILHCFRLTLGFGVKTGVNKTDLSDILKETNKQIMVAFEKDHPFYQLHAKIVAHYLLIAH